MVLALISLFFFTIGVAIFLGNAKRAANNRRDTRERAEQRISCLVDDHIETLARRRDTLVRTDIYGVIADADWNKEVHHFLNKVVQPALPSDEAQTLMSFEMAAFCKSLIETKVRDFSKTRPQSAQIPENISAIDFEGLCAAVLRKAGWDASTTKASGDQGADVVALKAGMRIVLQCKLYSGSVGNKAVQEVLAAKHFYSAQRAAVVCKSHYTGSARDLAIATGIDILTFSELESYIRKLNSAL